MTRTPGLYPDVPNTEYHKGLRSDVRPLSSTHAKQHLTMVPKKIKFQRDRAEERSDALLFGTALHELVLEGDFQTVDFIDAASFQGKASGDAKRASLLAGRTPLLAKQRPTLEGIAKELHTDPETSAFLSAEGAETELSALAFDPVNEVWLQARFDWILRNGKAAIFADLKTALDASEKGFGKAIAEYQYDLQDALYRRVLTLLGFTDVTSRWIVAEKTEPYIVAVHDIPESDRENGDLLLNKAIQKYKQYWADAANDYYPAYVGTRTAVVPAWRGYEIERMIGE